jgi:hypothetical protein
MIFAETWAEIWTLVLGSTWPGAETVRTRSPRAAVAKRTLVVAVPGWNCSWSFLSVPEEYK